MTAVDLHRLELGQRSLPCTLGPRRVKNQQRRLEGRRSLDNFLSPSLTSPVLLDPGSTSQVKSDPPPCGLAWPIRVQGRPGLGMVDSQSQAAVIPPPPTPSCSSRAPPCRRLSVHLPASRGLLAGVARPRRPASGRPTGRISRSAGRSCLRTYRLYLVSSRLVSHQILISLPSRSDTKRSSTSVPVHLLDKCEQNVNSF